MNRKLGAVLRITKYAPYVVFVVLVLTPFALAAYVVAAIARTIYSNARAGWKEHE